MSYATHRRLRLQLDSRYPASATDRVVNANPSCYRGEDVRLELALFVNGAFVDDVNALSEVVLEIKDLGPGRTAPSPGDPALIRKTLTGGVVADGDVTEAQWSASGASVAPLVIELSDSETNLTPGTKWLSVVVTFADGNQVTFLATSEFRILEDGSGGSAVASANAAVTFEGAIVGSRTVVVQSTAASGNVVVVPPGVRKGYLRINPSDWGSSGGLPQVSLSTSGREPGDELILDISVGPLVSDEGASGYLVVANQTFRSQETGQVAGFWLRESRLVVHCILISGSWRVAGTSRHV